MTQALVVLVNVPDEAIADAIGRAVVENGLAACVNCLSGVKSIYRWQGEIEQATEVSLLIKTTQTRYAELEAAIKEMHPYQVPEIIALPVVLGWQPYLNWIVDETRKDQSV